MFVCLKWGHSRLTLEAATSCAVLAAISCEHTISSSNFPLPCTTRSAASLQHNTTLNTLTCGQKEGFEAVVGIFEYCHFLQKSCGFHKESFKGRYLLSHTHTKTVAPHPTALEAEIRPSVQREFLA